MIVNERENRRQRLLDVAGKMMTAARTAPKAKGLDIVECCVVEGDDIRRISDVMKEIYAETGRPVYQLDSETILSAE
ncbi:MAG: ferredoxin, partial [Muribaculaceae bacterium]|nr:ferredoxin [Muribaculaceae bacterium]